MLAIRPDERVALEDLARVDVGKRDRSTIAEAALRDGLVAALAAAGLPALPTADADPAAEPAGSRLVPSQATRTLLAGGLVVGLAITLVGGYGYRWGWTGFSENDQLWDWLVLLVLPVALGTFAVWLKHGSAMSARRRSALGAVVVAFGIFVAAGYLLPIGWTGFRGNTLWDWLTLLVLPLSLTTGSLWRASERRIGRPHLALGAAAGIGLAVALVGGYADHWAWTGFRGNTLWDWASLVLGPVIVATLVIPAAIRWMSGNAERIARERRSAARSDAPTLNR